MIALGSFVTASLALAAPTEYCAESHAAKVRRNAVKAIIKTESVVVKKTLQPAKAALPCKRHDKSAVLTHPTGALPTE